MVIDGINYEWVEPIIINYSLIASTLSSCYHCVCECASVTDGVCVRVPKHLGQEVVGGDFNWSTAAGGPSGGIFYSKVFVGSRTHAASAELRWLFERAAS